MVCAAMSCKEKDGSISDFDVVQKLVLDALQLCQSAVFLIENCNTLFFEKAFHCFRIVDSIFEFVHMLVIVDPDHKRDNSLQMSDQTILRH